MSSPSPWSRLGLRCNPFGEPPPGELPGLVVADVGELADWWLAPGRRALQWTGPCGHGKSARLAALRARAPETPLVYLAEGEPAPPLPDGPRLLLDEAQRLPRRCRRHLFRRLEKIAIGTHLDLVAELEAAGFEVRHREVEPPDGVRLAAILERRLVWAEVAPGRAPRPTPAEVEGLRRRFGGDLRAQFDSLYETFQYWSRDRTASPWPDPDSGR